MTIGAEDAPVCPLYSKIKRIVGDKSRFPGDALMTFFADEGKTCGVVVWIRRFVEEGAMTAFTVGGGDLKTCF